jgi:hypothetical protein
MGADIYFTTTTSMVVNLIEGSTELRIRVNTALAPVGLDIDIVCIEDGLHPTLESIAEVVGGRRFVIIEVLRDDNGISVLVIREVAAEDIEAELTRDALHCLIN